jgi:hypothetical protein
MSKYLRVFLMAMLAVVLIASVAMAGTTKVNYGGANNPANISAQALASAKNVTLTGVTNGLVGNAAITYQLGQALTSGNLVKVSFSSGVGFAGNTAYAICAASNNGNNATEIANATPTGGAESFSFQTSLNSGTTNVASSNYIWLTTGTCNTTGSDVMIRIGANQTGTKTVTFELLTSGGQSIDSASSATLFKIQDEYTTTLSAADTVTIDYIGTPGNGTRFVSGTASTNLAGSDNKVNITKASMNYCAVNCAGTSLGNAGATANVVIKLTDTAEWQGVANIAVKNASGGGACPSSATDSTLFHTTVPASGQATINVPTAVFNGSGSSNVSVCIYATGANVLNTRTISGTTQVRFDSNGITMSETSSYPFQNWVVNAYQGLVPWLVKSDVFKAWCLINNNSSANANVTLATFSMEDGTPITSQSLGTIPAGKSQLYILGNEVTVGSANYPLTGITDNKRYSAIFTVTASRDLVTMACQQYNETFGKRLLPVLTDKDGSKWKQ